MDSIIFDVDGTLWDSTESVAQSWTAYLREKEHMDITLTSARLMTLFGPVSYTHLTLPTKRIV